MENAIKNAGIFTGLGEDLLEKIAARGFTRDIEKGGVIFTEEEPGRDFFILLDGMVRLGKSTQDGREVTIRVISPSEAFAETILFEHGRYPVTAMAMEDSRLFGISRDTFLELLGDIDFRDGFIAMLMKKQRYLADRILYLTAFDVEERFFRFLLENYGRREIYLIDLSKKDIASAIGTVPETLSRLLGRLKARKILEWEGGTIRLAGGFWEESDYQD